MKNNSLSVIYEDALILIVDKPAGMLTHPDKKLNQPDVITTLVADHHGSPTYGVINRLDFNTSGLVMIGKTQEAIKELNRLAIEKQIRKHYLCGVVGYFDYPEATLTDYLLKDSEQSVVRISSEELPNSKRIVTRYKVLDEYQGLSLLTVELLTGKTHQIRAHLAHHNHPIVGDPLYGYASINKKLGIKTQILCAYRLVFSIKDASSIFAYMNGKTIEIHRGCTHSLFPNAAIA